MGVDDLGLAQDRQYRLVELRVLPAFQRFAVMRLQIGQPGSLRVPVDQEALLDFARERGLARLTIDQGWGAETMWEPQPVTVSPGGVPVAIPAGAFLQATLDGEDVLVAAAREWLDGAATVADLFSGLGDEELMRTAWS